MMKNNTATKKLTVAALFMALNIALSSFGVPVPGGHFYLCDAAICTLVTHGIQAAVISLFANRLFAGKPKTGAVTGVIAGAFIMVTGYSLGRAFIYSTAEYAVIKLPYEILQASVGAVAGVVLCYPCGLHKLYTKLMNEQLP